jgi:hypothetical protein
MVPGHAGAGIVEAPKREPKSLDGQEGAASVSARASWEREVIASFL